MKILVIGNGFDLEHGLSTKYKDFLDFMQGISSLIENNCSITEKDFCDDLEKKVRHKVDENIKEYLTQEKFLDPDSMKKWKEEENSKELIESANNNIWIKYFLENIEYENQGWIDFESEISNVIQCFDYGKELSKYLKKYNEWPTDRDKYKEEIVQKIIEYGGLNLKLFELIDKNLKQIIDNLNEHLNNLIRCLEIYLEECVGKIDIEYVSPDIKDIKFDKVLSFNYTNTYERIYGFNNNDIEYHYIHGEADITRTADENNMVLGIDEYLDDEAKNMELEFIAFKKYFQRIYKKTGNRYKKWIIEMKKLINYKLYSKSDSINFDNETDKKIIDLLKKSMEFEKYNTTNHIYIFGHSLDVTDKDIIKELIECENTETTIFYYNKEVYAQQIANMVKIIKQDELIKRVSGADPTIMFKQQQQRIGRN